MTRTTLSTRNSTLFDLPLAKHRFVIEPISGSPHVCRTLVRRYLSFIENIKKSMKIALRELLEIVQRDVRTTTGANMRFIMLMTGHNRVEDMEAGKADFQYNTVSEANIWKVNFTKEIIDVGNYDLSVDGMGQR